MNNVDSFIEYSDFFTLDVADYIGKQTNDEKLKQFTDTALKYAGTLSIPDTAFGTFHSRWKSRSNSDKVLK